MDETKRSLLTAAAIGPLSVALLATGAAAQAPAAPAPGGRSGLIGDITRRGTLRVGLSTFVPYAMRSKTGELIGYEVDLAKKLAEDMGVKPEFVPTPWDGIIPALLSGSFDMIISNMSITPQRNLTVNFSAPTTSDGMHLVAHKTTAAGLGKLDDFNKAGVTLALRRGTVAMTATQRLMPKATIRQFDDDAQALLEVVNGRAHALVTAFPRTVFASLDYPDQLFIPIEKPFTNQPSGIALRKGDADALNFLNNWLLVRHSDGFIEEKRGYWFGAREWKDQVPA